MPARADGETWDPGWTDGTPSTVRSSPPDLGEHSVEVLKELGHTEAKIAQASERGAFE